MLLSIGAAANAQEPELTGGFVDLGGARPYYEVGGGGNGARIRSGPA